ncbi:MAG: hypothetical protein JZU55_13355, partial [Afipia sp.]|nr:hypothetical protein [Afipia sp.]
WRIDQTRIMLRESHMRVADRWIFGSFGSFTALAFTSREIIVMIFLGHNEPPAFTSGGSTKLPSFGISLWGTATLMKRSYTILADES